MSDESLFREVDEEVRQEEFKKLWKRYGNLVIALAVAVVVAVGGFKAWQYWQLKQAHDAASVFFGALAKGGNGKADEALKELGSIGQAGYGQLARIEAAALLASQGKTEDAVKAYEAVAADPSADPVLRDAANIRAGYLLADSKSPDELLSRFGSYEKDGNPWRFAAREIFGLAAYRTGDYSMADRYMNAIFSDAAAPEAMRQRAQVMIQLLTPLLPKS